MADTKISARTAVTAAATTQELACNDSGASKKVSLAQIQTLIAPSIAARVTKSAAQTLTNDTTTTISWDAETRDDGGVHDNVTNNSRLTVPSGAGGWYLVTATLQYTTNATGARSCVLRLNGTTTIAVQTAGPSAAQISVTAATLIYLAATDYIEVQGYQTSGGDLDVVNTVTSASMIRVAA